jgi:hypothetical protein
MYSHAADESLNGRVALGVDSKWDEETAIVMKKNQNLV